MSKNDFKSAALLLGKAGYRVFPVRGKIPAVKWKEAATTVSKEIEALWDEYPTANIGIACGEGLVVIDFDDPGCEAAKWLTEKLPPTLTCSTGRGRHYYYRCKNSKALRNLQLHGVDLRTDGGLVVGPGSVHKNGTVYEFEQGWSVEPAELPEEVFEYLKASTKKKKEEGGTSKTKKSDGEGIPQGTRHAWLLSETWRLACTSRLDSDQLMAIVRETLIPQCENPESILDYEVEEIVRGAIAKRNRFALPLNQLTEAGLADTFIEFYADNVVALNGSNWKVFDEDTGLWEKEPGPQNLVLPVREAVYQAVASTANDNKDVLEKAGAFYKTSGTFRWLDSVTKLVAPRLTVSEPDFQIPGNALPFQNGMFELGTGNFRGFRPGDFVRETIDANYDPSANCPLWLETINYLTTGDLECVRYLQQVLGFLLSSETIRGVFYFVGVRNSGKNTLVCTLNDILGRALVSPASKALIHVSRNDDDEQQARRNLALVGRRFVWIDETNNNDVVDSQKFKSIASTDTRLVARRLRQDAFDFVNNAKVVVMSNYPPRIDPDDDAAWSRVVYVPFQAKIPDHVRRPEFRSEVMVEADGIIAWCLAGYKDYLERGRKFAIPEIVERNIRIWQEDSTPLLEFVRTQCELGAGLECTAQELFGAYETWHRNLAFGDIGKFKGAPQMMKTLRRVLGNEIGDRRTKHERFVTGVAPIDHIIS
jgi:putative DNA primase/helicase